VNPYDQAQAELFVVPAAGGTRTRLAANDPPACMGVASPGITNSWARWSPVSSTGGGKTYYWLVFSSKRAGASQAQLYLTSVVADAAGALTTHGAIHLWNQPEAESNHTPAWDEFQIPPAPVPIK
jgi:hypothetical protein